MKLDLGWKMRFERTILQVKKILVGQADTQKDIVTTRLIQPWPRADSVITSFTFSL